MPVKMCVHCGERVATRTRGLCGRDFYDLEVRALYPAGHPSKYAQRGEDDTPGPSRRGTPAVLTFAKCGKTKRDQPTKDTIALLTERAARREALAQPGDRHLFPEATYAPPDDESEGE